jgi:hypothetical protein
MCRKFSKFIETKFINGISAIFNQKMPTVFHSRTVYLDIIKVFSPTDGQENCFKKCIKFYIKIAPTYFGVITIIRERTI